MYDSQCIVSFSVRSVSVPWGISHEGRTAGWWAPWWGRWRTAPRGCRAHTQRGPTLKRRLENRFLRFSWEWRENLKLLILLECSYTTGSLPPLSVLLRAPSLCGHSSHLWDRMGREQRFDQSLSVGGWVKPDWKDLLCPVVCGCTHHTRRPLLWLTLPTEPRTSGHLDDAIARWDTNTHTECTAVLFPLLFF